eukprot:gene27442-33145_t
MNSYDNPYPGYNPGDVVLIAEKTRLEHILRDFSPTLDCISPLRVIDIADQYGTILDVKSFPPGPAETPAKFEDAFAIILLENGMDIALPLVAFEVMQMEVLEASDEHFVMPTMGRPGFDGGASSAPHSPRSLPSSRHLSSLDRLQEQCIVEELAVDCIAGAYRRYRERRRGQGKLAKQNTGEKVEVKDASNNARPVINNDPPTVKEVINSPAKEIPPPNNYLSVAIKNIRVRGLPSALPGQQNTPYPLLTLSSSGQDHSKPLWAYRDQALPEAGEQGKWDGERVFVPFHTTLPEPLDTLTLTFFHECRAISDRPLASIVLPLDQWIKEGDASGGSFTTALLEAGKGKGKARKEAGVVSLDYSLSVSPPSASNYPPPPAHKTSPSRLRSAEKTTATTASSAPANALNIPNQPNLVNPPNLSAQQSNPPSQPSQSKTRRASVKKQPVPQPPNPPASPPQQSTINGKAENDKADKAQTQKDERTLPSAPNSIPVPAPHPHSLRHSMRSNSGSSLKKDGAIRRGSFGASTIASVGGATSASNTNIATTDRGVKPVGRVYMGCKLVYVYDYYYRDRFDRHCLLPRVNVSDLLTMLQAVMEEEEADKGYDWGAYGETISKKGKGKNANDTYPLPLSSPTLLAATLREIFATASSSTSEIPPALSEKQAILLCEGVQRLIRGGEHNFRGLVFLYARSGSPSSWTAELMLPLLRTINLIPPASSSATLSGKMFLSTPASVLSNQWGVNSNLLQIRVFLYQEVLKSLEEVWRKGIRPFDKLSNSSLFLEDISTEETAGLDLLRYLIDRPPEKILKTMESQPGLVVDDLLVWGEVHPSCSLPSSAAQPSLSDPSSILSKALDGVESGGRGSTLQLIASTLQNTAAGLAYRIASLPGLISSYLSYNRTYWHLPLCMLTPLLHLLQGQVLVSKEGLGAEEEGLMWGEVCFITSQPSPHPIARIIQGSGKDELYPILQVVGDGKGMKIFVKCPRGVLNPLPSSTQALLQSFSSNPPFLTSLTLNSMQQDGGGYVRILPPPFFQRSLTPTPWFDRPPLPQIWAGGVGKVVSILKNDNSTSNDGSICMVGVRLVLTGPGQSRGGRVDGEVIDAIPITCLLRYVGNIPVPLPYAYNSNRDEKVNVVGNQGEEKGEQKKKKKSRRRSLVITKRRKSRSNVVIEGKEVEADESEEEAECSEVGEENKGREEIISLQSNKGVTPRLDPPAPPSLPSNPTQIMKDSSANPTNKPIARSKNYADVNEIPSPPRGDESVPFAQLEPSVPQKKTRPHTAGSVRSNKLKEPKESKVVEKVGKDKDKGGVDNSEKDYSWLRSPAPIPLVPVSGIDAAKDDNNENKVNSKPASHNRPHLSTIPLLFPDQAEGESSPLYHKGVYKYHTYDSNTDGDKKLEAEYESPLASPARLHARPKSAPSTRTHGNRRSPSPNPPKASPNHHNHYRQDAWKEREEAGPGRGDHVDIEGGWGVVGAKYLPGGGVDHPPSPPPSPFAGQKDESKKKQKAKNVLKRRVYPSPFEYHERKEKEDDVGEALGVTGATARLLTKVQREDRSQPRGGEYILSHQGGRVDAIDIGNNGSIGTGEGEREIKFSVDVRGSRGEGLGVELDDYEDAEQHVDELEVAGEVDKDKEKDKKDAKSKGAGGSKVGTNLREALYFNREQKRGEKELRRKEDVLFRELKRLGVTVEDGGGK